MRIFKKSGMESAKISSLTLADIVRTNPKTNNKNERKDKEETPSSTPYTVYVQQTPDMWKLCLILLPILDDDDDIVIRNRQKTIVM